MPCFVFWQAAAVAFVSLFGFTFTLRAYILILKVLPSPPFFLLPSSFFLRIYLLFILSYHHCYTHSPVSSSFSSFSSFSLTPPPQKKGHLLEALGRAESLVHRHLSHSILTLIVA